MSTGTATESSREALPASPVRLALRGMLRRPGALFGGSVLCGMVLLALLAPWISPYDPLATIVMVTHDLPYAFELCERSVILSGGVIVADGETGDILKDQPLLAKHRLELPVGFSL